MPQVDPIPYKRMLFPAINVHNTIMVGNIARNVECVSHTVLPAGIVDIMLDADLLKMHKEQIVIEKEHDNSLGESYFEPMNEKTCQEKE